MNDVLNWASTVLVAALGLAFLLTMIRLVRGPSLPDRVVAVDLITAIGMTLCAAMAVIYDETVFLDVAIVMALITFVGTVAFARYIDMRSKS